MKDAEAKFAEIASRPGAVIVCAPDVYAWFTQGGSAGAAPYGGIVVLRNEHLEPGTVVAWDRARISEAFGPAVRPAPGEGTGR